MSACDIGQLATQPDQRDSLVSLGSVFERREDVPIRSVFDAVDKVGDLGEERVVICEDVALFVIVFGPATRFRESTSAGGVVEDTPNVESGSVIGIYESNRLASGY